MRQPSDLRLLGDRVLSVASRLRGLSATVTLEPWGSGDLPLLERLMGDPRMTERLGGPESPDGLRERQGRYERLAGGDRGFKIVEVASGASVGSVGFWTKAWRTSTMRRICSDRCGDQCCTAYRCAAQVTLYWTSRKKSSIELRIAARSDCAIDSHHICGTGTGEERVRGPYSVLVPYRVSDFMLNGLPTSLVGGAGGVPPGAGGLALSR